MEPTLKTDLQYISESTAIAQVHTLTPQYMKANKP